MNKEIEKAEHIYNDPIVQKGMQRLNELLRVRDQGEVSILIFIGKHSEKIHGSLEIFDSRKDERIKEALDRVGSYLKNLNRK